MRPHQVEVLAPCLNDDAGFGPRPEPFEAQAVIAELAVETLRRVLPGLGAIRSVPSRHTDLRSISGARARRTRVHCRTQDGAVCRAH